MLLVLASCAPAVPRPVVAFDPACTNDDLRDGDGLRCLQVVEPEPAPAWVSALALVADALPVVSAALRLP